MRISILGFNQEEVIKIEPKLNMEDLLLLDYIQRAGSNPNMHRYIEEKDGLCYVWLSHSKLLEDLPILDIKESALQKKLKKLKDCGLLQSNTFASNKGRGSKTYYAITQRTLDLQNTTTCKNLRVEEEPDVKNYGWSDGPHVKNYGSNSKQLTTNIDKELNKTNSKELVQDFTFGTKQKQPKENLYTKCQHMINDFTDNPQVRVDLQDYLQLLLEMKSDGYNLYANTWKGLLNKLKKLSDNPNKQHDIIRQSIERGYKSFFPANNVDNSKKKFGEENGVYCVPITDEQLKEIDRLNEEREKKGLRTYF